MAAPWEQYQTAEAPKPWERFKSTPAPLSGAPDSVEAPRPTSATPGSAPPWKRYAVASATPPAPTLAQSFAAVPEAEVAGADAAWEAIKNAFHSNAVAARRQYELTKKVAEGTATPEERAEQLRGTADIALGFWGGGVGEDLVRGARVGVPHEPAPAPASTMREPNPENVASAARMKREVERDRTTEAKQRQTADLLRGARESVTPLTFTPADLGPKLTGQVNMARFRSGKAATDNFTAEDLRDADVPQQTIDRLSLVKQPSLARLRGGEGPEPSTEPSVEPSLPPRKPSPSAPRRVPIFEPEKGDILGAIRRLISTARAPGNKAAALRFGKVDPSTVAAAKSQGIDIAGYDHVMQTDELRHALTRHGADARLPPDQLPIDEGDLARVPEIVRNPDEVRQGTTDRGLAGLTFIKHEGDSTFVVEEVRTGRRQLAFKTMYKLRGEAGGPGGMNAPPEGGPSILRPEPAPGTASNNMAPRGAAGKTATGMPSEGPLSRAPDLNAPRTFEHQLFQLETNKTADRIDVLKHLRNVPDDVPPATWERLYHHEEDPTGVPLTTEEQALYDKHVAPLKAEADDLSAELERLGYPTERAEAGEGFPKAGASEGYTPRYVKGRTRSFGEALAQWKDGVEAKFGGAPGRSMRKTVDAQRSRRFWNAVNPETGERTVVHVGTDGRVLAFDGSPEPVELGTFPKGQKIGPGSKIRVDRRTWRLESATTKQIEAVAKTRYVKNVLANRLDNLAKLRSAVRNARFIEAMKSSPDWDKVAIKVSDTAVPPKTNGREWRIPKLPQFRQYYMEARLADALDDFMGHQREIEGLSGALDKAGNLIKGSIFWNPLPHMRNVANHYFVEKGLFGNTRDLVTGSTFRSLLRAARAVTTLNEDYIRALRSGASLPYAKLISRDVHEALIAKLGEDVARNPGEWSRIAALAGKANPLELIRSLYGLSSRALWGFGDWLSVARIMELEEKGIGIERAVRLTEEHMPNYRIPGQVLGQRWLSQLLQNPLATMFGRYQYNRLASYLNMARDMVGRNVPLKDRAAALDKLAMLGVLLFAYYPMLDRAWQAATGNPNAKVSRPGATSVPQAVIDLVKGDKDAPQAFASLFSLGTVTAPIELATGRYLWNGEPIARLDDLRAGRQQFFRDLMAWVGSKLQPVGQAQRIVEGGVSPSQFLLQQLGVSTPTDEQVQMREHFRQRDARDAARRAARKALQRESR